jgi:hypothetical protein
MTIKEFLKNIYIEYKNNYLTSEKMAEHNEMDEQDIKMLIEMGRYYYNNRY